MLEQAFSLLINEIALDIGSCNIRAYVKGRALYLEEPAVVIAEEQKGKTKLLVYGNEALQMIGRTPKHQQAYYPLRNGIEHPILAQKLLEKFLEQALGGKSMLKPRMIASCSQYYQQSAFKKFRHLVTQLGGKDSQIIDSLICSTLGSSLPIDQTKAMMIINIGYSHTEVGILCLSNVYKKISIPIAGQSFDRAIQQNLQKEHRIRITEQNAESLKLALGCAMHPDPQRVTQFLSRDIRTGAPIDLYIRSTDIQKAIHPLLRKIIERIQQFFSKVSPRVSADLLENGIILCGGSAQLENLPLFIQEHLNLPVILIDTPKQVSVMGANRLLTEESYLHWLVK